jgi:hypothetical protein
MWSAEHSIETSAWPEAVWGLWADVPGWPEWNADLARAELDGEFTAGPDADTVGPELGPQISGDFPNVLKALADRADC